MLCLLGILISLGMLYLLCKFLAYIIGGSSEKHANDAQVTMRTEPVEIDQSILNNAVAFAGMCRKMAKGEGKSCYPVKYKLLESSMAGVEVWAIHTIHDNTLLECARDYAMNGDRRNAEIIYNQMTEKYNLTEAEMRSFRDVSDFMEFLRGGVSGYNSCEISGHDMTITQKIGGFVGNSAKEAVLSGIEKAVLGRYSDAKAAAYGTTILTINF